MIQPVRDRASFEAFRTVGRRVNAGPLWVSVLDSPGGDVHVAYAIGSRFGGAVQRNRMRRRLRELVRALEPSLPPGRYLIGVRPNAADLSSIELSECVKRLRDRVVVGA